MEEKKNENIEKLEEFVNKVNALTNDLKGKFVALVGKYGCNNELETFDYCSEYGCYLDESTIDKIAVEGDNLMFYFNENTNDCEDFNEFLVSDLNKFYNELKAAIADSIGENEGETQAARHDMGV